uniref:CS domain-containing protein n=1 Tax=Amorphochlora amoebiformis TaxID=1561963 RepID=A0A7S0GY02_9EUKA
MPRIPRASKIALEVGRPSDVRGDAFFGRVFDDQENWDRVNFTLDDVKSDAKWITTAKELKKKNVDMGGDALKLKQMLASRGGQEPAMPEGKSEKYSWKQSSDDVEVTIPVDSKVRSKDVKVDLKSKSLAISVNNNCLISGDLFSVVRASESNWSMSTEGNGKEISIMMEKAAEKTWSSLFKE